MAARETVPPLLDQHVEIGTIPLEQGFQERVEGPSDSHRDRHEGSQRHLLQEKKDHDAYDGTHRNPHHPPQKGDGRHDGRQLG